LPQPDDPVATSGGEHGTLRVGHAVRGELAGKPPADALDDRVLAEVHVQRVRTRLASAYSAGKRQR
jgi:hypothetical protein